MTKRQQLTPATLAMSRPLTINRTDPAVEKWVNECGLASTPVAIKLTGESEADVNTQIQRLERAFGSLISMTTAHRISDGVTWIAHGTLLA